MTIVFRLNYRTVPGQSLWLHLDGLSDGVAMRFEIPLRWSDEWHWEATLEIPGDRELRLDYTYQMRQEGNGVVLDEWAGPRRVVADGATHDALRLCDTWRSAGTVDYAFETNAFTTVMPARGPFTPWEVRSGDTHEFLLRMAAVPTGCVPCLIGGVAVLGDWDWARAIPLHEVSANLWQTSIHLPTHASVDYKYGLWDTHRQCATSLEGGGNRVLETCELSQRQWTRVQDEHFRRDPAGLYRAAGVAIPVFSLRSDLSLGVGEFADLKRLADWAARVGLKLMQILPINDTTASHDWTDSYPYSAISVFALHPIYLRIDEMPYAMPASFAVEFDAHREELQLLEHLDYEQVMMVKSTMTRRVFASHQLAITQGDGFKSFLADHRTWLLPYAAFCVLRDAFGTPDFSLWQDWARFDATRVDAMTDANHPDHAEIYYHIWLQYELARQLADAVAYLHGRGLALKGDLPIGIDRHSVDAWTAPHLFHSDAQVGAPPDAFAQKGQNWGFPAYNWQVMSEDGYAWWRSRFSQLSHYFDAYRIDHILGFFRIWQIPYDQIDGIMGWFEPAQPIHIDEIRERGISIEWQRFCQPYIRDAFLSEIFGDAAQVAKDLYLTDSGNGVYQLRSHVATQRRIVEHFATLRTDDAQEQARHDALCAGLLDCVSDVLWFEVPGSHGTLFHPRIALQTTRSFQALDNDTQSRVDALYRDYFYERQEDFWQARGYEKLPVMRRASPMLLCGEDLGMVPDCVPGVLEELGILSLEIQRMPKRADTAFFDPAHAPYMSVVSTSTHDMSPLRAWWREDVRVTANFAWQMLGEAFPAPDLSGDLAARIISQHLQSPAMWAIFPLQDLLAIDEGLRHPDPEAERINVPAIARHKWNYRMHLGLDELVAADGFNSRLTRMLEAAGRATHHALPE